MFVIKYYLCKCCSSHFSFRMGRLSPVFSVLWAHPPFVQPCSADWPISAKLFSYKCSFSQILSELLEYLAAEHKAALDAFHSIYGASSIFVSDGPEQSHRICGLRDNGCVTFCLTNHHPLWQNDRDSLVERNRETISALRSNTVYSAFIIIWRCVRLVQRSQTCNSWTRDPNKWT